MTGPQSNHDKTFRGELAAIHRAEQDDPLAQAVAVISKTMGLYRRSLLAQGFTSEEAMGLLIDWQRTILAHVKL